MQVSPCLCPKCEALSKCAADEARLKLIETVPQRFIVDIIPAGPHPGGGFGRSDSAEYCIQRYILHPQLPLPIQIEDLVAAVRNSGIEEFSHTKVCNARIGKYRKR